MLEMAGYKETGSCEKLIVTGCMVQRFGNALRMSSLRSTISWARASTTDRRVLRSKTRPLEDSCGCADVHSRRVRPSRESWKDTRRGSRSAKAATIGARSASSRPCAARCEVAPLHRWWRRLSASWLRGSARSASSVRTRRPSVGPRRWYGSRRSPEALAKVEGLDWIRLHYAYPIGLPDSLWRLFGTSQRCAATWICRFSTRRAQCSRRCVAASLRPVRSASWIGSDRANIAIRTTFIVGFPGETDEDFAELVDFVESQQFERVGVFTTSRRRVPTPLNCRIRSLKRSSKSGSGFSWRPKQGQQGAHGCPCGSDHGRAHRWSVG